MKTIALATGVLFAAATASQAQNVELICHHAGLTYSAGSMVTMGKSLQKCTATDVGAIWLPSTSEDRGLESANCVFGGNEYGHGAVLDAVAAVLKCSNGNWFPD